MAPGVETAEVAIQFAFGWPNAGVVGNDERSVDPYYGTTSSGLGLDPRENVVHSFKTVDLADAQVRSGQAD